ncbi:uncharacterized protein LOC127730005 isoform X9 [Mytilus californianus]|uniref:uncharacterized protein LOC127730005 isoform X9 n=1 Tax=Mytilus californianus TaxID=6549 RepID=UPI00224535B8|nr:uncharacterized protein LOC127730005 isoform X9 [Mytilus californianus]XP_052093984.1 uncharacterized protein LOC127730005 isoform X9 [Mytilus californianus]XP_052093985.1 uncharacterized protein LOC127730005 isoform X9 [Mytilus californianus]XP_052093986.1 uncharacterized protein LOC127730005 isoform X9 [Mytilus californianus]
MIDLCKIKEDFSGLVKEAQPWTLTQFVMWLDLKLSEFKIKGYMVLDHHTKTKPKWIEEEDSTSDVAPIPAPCRTCNKHSNDGHFYSDIHASPTGHRNVTREMKNVQPMEESESVRGEVGIIDLSHAEINRKQNSARMLRPPDVDMSHKKSYQNTSYHEKSPNILVERDKNRQDDVIEIDVPSPTEKMFITSNINKTSTPVVHANIRPVQKPKNRPSLSMGTAIYTTTSSVTTPTFSSSYMSSPSRNIPPTFTNRKFALGAPPPPLVAPSNLANLDEMIAQAVQFNEIRTDISGSQSQTRQSSGQSDVRPPPMQQQQPPKIQESDHSSSFSEQHSRQTMSEQHSRQTISEQHSRQSNISEQKLPYSQQTSTSSSAVPIALHANIDNINISQNSAHSSSDTMEIKIETEVDDSVADSFFVGGMDDTDSADYGNDLHSERDDPTYNMSASAMGQYRKDVELPTFEDPIVRRALEDNKPPSRHMWSKIITRCAYHLLSKGVPRKHDYQAFAESFFRRYPCVGTSRGPNPWTSFTKSVSQKVRTLRYISKRRYSHQKLKIKS